MSVDTLAVERYGLDRIEAIAARLDLRAPNQEALESIAFETIRHFELDQQPPPFEAVVDVATGVGKTYILAAALEYFAEQGGRDFAVITPGRTILDKTVANFTPGHPKSLLDGLETRPVVITSENFNTPLMRAVMDDPARVKLYIFTVQALLKPQTKLGRRTHKFQEGLGEAFYAHLQRLNDLVVFADEHHTYYGSAFSAAVRELRPRILLGLTATPHKKTPPEQIIYRYPLAAAIADRLVKTPVLVGRHDDRSDPATKLRDGLRLLELKEQLIRAWCDETGAAPLTPVMLVVAPSIAEAEEIAAIAADPSFAAGRYFGQVLTVHSSAPDEALAQLAQLEEPDNPYRIVVSVGMLKEGWDVKNVYVIASLRASVSELLTEQTLGRGLRLPFGRYTGIELLDTLEVLGHERYEQLLQKTGVLNQQFIDLRTRAVLRRDAAGRAVPVIESTPVQATFGGEESSAPNSSPEAPATDAGRPLVLDLEQHTRRAEAQALALQVELAPRTDLPPLRIPRLQMTTIASSFSLADITDLTAFRRLGEHIRTDPSDSLRRVKLDARVITGADGLRQTMLVTGRAADQVASPAARFPLEELRGHLLTAVLAAPVVPARANQRWPAEQIVDAFLAGLGPDAERILSGVFERAAAALVQQVTQEQRAVAAKPRYDEVVELTTFNQRRLGRVETSQDRFGPFKRGVGYQGFRKSLYAQDWFDSSTEREVANVLDDAEAIAFWVRLQVGDLPILWSGAREYNPDFIAVDPASRHWLVEVKMDKEMTSESVQQKRQAAQRWANHVSADGAVANPWRYLLVSESDVAASKGSWEALRALGE